MRNPTYSNEFKAVKPWPYTEKVCSMRFVPAGEEAIGAGEITTPMLSVGIKQMTHSWRGEKLIPHHVVAFEITDGEEIASFAIDARLARIYANRLNEFAAAIENGED